MLELEQVGGDVILPVDAQPKARRNAILGVHAGRLKIAVTQAPEKGKANTALAKVLSDQLGVKRSQIRLVSGATNSRKKFLIADIEINELRRRIDACLS